MYGISIPNKQRNILAWSPEVAGERNPATSKGRGSKFIDNIDALWLDIEGSRRDAPHIWVTIGGERPVATQHGNIVSGGQRPQLKKVTVHGY
jgi:hypothetical protein